MLRLLAHEVLKTSPNSNVGLNLKIEFIDFSFQIHSLDIISTCLKS